MPDDKKISQLAQVIEATQNDLLAIVNSGQTCSISRGNLLKTVDLLTSGSTVNPLSANQGAVLKALIEAADYRGVRAWAGGHVYLVADMAEVGGQLYKCLVAHTAGTFATDVAAGKWQALAAATVSGTFEALKTMAAAAPTIPFPCIASDYGLYMLYTGDSTAGDSGFVTLASWVSGGIT